MVKVVIIDDDVDAVEMLMLLLKQHTELSVVGTAHNGVQGKKTVMRERPDLLFLDMELPDVRGFDFLQQNKSNFCWKMKVVFHTAYDKYMLQAIRESAFDYLLKPITQKDVNAVMERYFRVESQKEMVNLSPQCSTVVQGGQKPFFATTFLNDVQLFRVQNIGFFKYNSDRRLWEVALDNTSNVMLKGGTTAEKILGFSRTFVQVHQSYIINIDYLLMIRDNRCVLYPPFEKVNELIISRAYRKKLEEQMWGI